MGTCPRRPFRSPPTSRHLARSLLCHCCSEPRSLRLEPWPAFPQTDLQGMPQLANRMRLPHKCELMRLYSFREYPSSMP